MNDRIHELEQEEAELVFARFDQLTAWRLGTRLVETALERDLGVVIDIRKPGLTLFRASLPGTAPDQQIWVERKAALVQRIETSGALFEARMKAYGVDPVAIGWLNDDYAVTAGALPIRVAGVGVVGVVTASGLSSDEDHALVAEGIRAQIAEEASA